MCMEGGGQLWGVHSLLLLGPPGLELQVRALSPTLVLFAFRIGSCSEDHASLQLSLSEMTISCIK